MPRAFLVKKSTSGLSISPPSRRSPGEKEELSTSNHCSETSCSLLSSPHHEKNSLPNKQRRIPGLFVPYTKDDDYFEYSDKDVEKPFECRHCIVSFNRLRDLQNHMELHTVASVQKFHDGFTHNQLENSHQIESLFRSSELLLRKPNYVDPFRSIELEDFEGQYLDKSYKFNRRTFFPPTNEDFEHAHKYNSPHKESQKKIATNEEPILCSPTIPIFCSPELSPKNSHENSRKLTPQIPVKYSTPELPFNSKQNYITQPTQTTQDNGELPSDKEMVEREDTTSEKPFKCSNCVMSFTRPSDLQRHLLIHSSNKPYRCDKCDREFTWFGNFQKHILSHVRENMPSSGTSSEIFTLLAREQVKDLFIKEGDKYRCRLCNKDFTRLSGLKTHIRMHTGERPYVCEVCSFAFTTSRALKMHTRLHTGEKPYKCEVCDRAFTRRDEMHTHMYIHKGEKPFKCSECSASFIRYGHLQRHLLIHSDEKPYKCKLCPKSFTQYRNLQTHTYKHTGERPYKCKYCPKGFTQYGTLQAHERTHTGEKPFKCQMCEKAFITSSHLRWHIKTQHPKN